MEKMEKKRSPSRKGMRGARSVRVEERWSGEDVHFVCILENDCSSTIARISRGRKVEKIGLDLRNACTFELSIDRLRVD